MFTSVVYLLNSNKKNHREYFIYNSFLLSTSYLSNMSICMLLVFCSVLRALENKGYSVVHYKRAVLNIIEK